MLRSERSAEKRHTTINPKGLMTPEEREQMNRLCTQIQDEKDHDRFMQLIKELNDLIDRKEHRFEPRPEKTEVQLIMQD
jgi:hypothetical protein